MQDHIIKAVTKDAGIQATAIYSRTLVERARQIHQTLPLATAALGRTLSAASMMGSQLKVPDGSITVQIKGNGSLGAVTAVSDAEGYVRGYLQNPAADLPLRADGKLDVGGGIGRGYLMVMKDIGLKEPVSGMVALVNGEIAEDVTRYFAESEQIPSACALGVLVDTDQSVKQAGGYLIQLMPGVKDTEIDQLENNIKNASAITGMLEQGMTLEEIVRCVLDGFDVEVLRDQPVEYRCSCNREKVIRALLSLGREELTKMADEEENSEITCQFCDAVYRFTRDEIIDLIAQAKKE